jgi:hypothetical protein
MKRFRLLCLVLIAVALWSGVASADLFYSTGGGGNSTFGEILGSDYNVYKELRTGVHDYSQALSFTDHKGNSWVVVDEYDSGSSAPDTVDIYDTDIWAEPAAERTDWGKNLKSLAVVDNFLYIVAFERYEGPTQASGQIIRVNLDNGFAPDGIVYKFAPNTDLDPILRRPCAIEVIDGKLYVLTYTYDGNHSQYAGFGPSELFEFDGSLNLLRKTAIGPSDDSAKNAAFLAQYGGNLYVGSSGGALGNPASAGAIWKIDPSTLESEKFLNLGSVLTDPVFSDKNKGISGLSFAKDGTAYLLVGGYGIYWDFAARFYVTTVNRLANGDLGAQAPVAEDFGYTWGVVYDERLETLWFAAGTNLEARSKDGLETRKKLTPADLGGNLYTYAIIYIPEVFVEPTIPELGEDAPDDVESLLLKIATQGEVDSILSGNSVANYIEKVSNGYVVKQSLSEKLAEEELGYGVDKVNPLPMFTAELTEGQVASVGFKVKGSDLLAATPQDVRLLKILGAAECEFFRFAGTPAEYADGAFTILDGNNTIPRTIESGNEYTLALFIEDDGTFDLDKGDGSGKIFDPAAIIGATNNQQSGGSGSGGCDAGAGAFALLFLAAAALFKSRRR